MSTRQEFELVLALLLKAENKQIVGRTLLQKEAYFVNEKLDLDIPFEPHYYGPYSRQLSSAIDTLVGLGAVTETEEHFASWNRSWGQTSRYSYELTELGEKLASELLTDEGQLNQLDEVVKQLKESGLLNDYKSISSAAKIHHVVKRSKKPVTFPEIEESAKRIGWHLEKSEIQKLADSLANLGLVTKRKKKR